MGGNQTPATVDFSVGILWKIVCYRDHELNIYIKKGDGSVH